ncbi:MAG TPA: O-antigen ligase family protein [Rhodanobacteraceae bacterium]
MPETLHPSPFPATPEAFWLRGALTLLTALVPLSLVIHSRLKIIPPALLFLLGLYLIATRRDVRRAYRLAWPVTAAAALSVLYAIANTLGHGLGASALGVADHVLLYLAVAAVFVDGINWRWLWIGFSLTAIGLGVFCIVQHFGYGVARAYSTNGGASTSIEFATVMLGLAVTALVQLLRAQPGKPLALLHGAAVALGIYGALLTQSRGPLLAFIPVFLGLLVLKGCTSRHWRWCLGALAIFVIGGAVAVASMHGATLKRFAVISQQVTEADAGQVDTSVGARLEMWRTATRAFVEHPLAGLGIDRFQAYVHAEIAAGRSDPSIAHYNNPHDMYLGAAAAGGVPGLLVLLIWFIAPLIYFARHVRAHDARVATAAWSGLAIGVLYMLCAVTDSVFYRVMSQSFYCLLILGLALAVAHARQTRHAGHVG